MNDLSSQNLESYVPVYDVVPEQWEQARPFLVEMLKRLSNAVNIREIGWYLDEELLSGKAFIPSSMPGDNSTPQQFRQILRKVIDFGVLPNNTIKSVPHGILVDFNFTLIDLYGAATDPTSFLGLPIPFVDDKAFDLPIELNMDATNINIVTTSDRRNFTRCFIICEYLQEV